jgi:peptide/nickel transport system permease protein
MRALLIPGEAASILAVLFVFGTYLPDAASGVSPCTLTASACSGCRWSDLSCSLTAFGEGFETFLVRMFTGDWGFASFGNLVEPAWQYLVWWLPYSIELAALALVITIAIAYPLGLLSGMRRDSPVDVGTQIGSGVVLLVPTFFVLLLVYEGLYQPFFTAFGDTPYGILPNIVWFGAHGGYPPWIGQAGSTTPSGFPIFDALWHGDWAVAEIVLVKTTLQAALIALTYVQIYLRFFRQAVRRVLDATWVVAARARGLSERQVVWHHAGRRALPLFLLVFASTVPAFLGTQMIVEVLANDPGLGPILLSELADTIQSGFGFTGSVTSGNFWQVLLFLTVFLVLITRFGADVLARYLDPRRRFEAGP